MTADGPSSDDVSSLPPNGGRFEALTGFRPARLEVDPDDSSFARSLLIVSGVRVVLVTLGLGLASWKLKNSHLDDAADIASWQYLVIGVAYGAGLVAIFALQRGRFLRPVAFGQVIVDAAIVTAVVVMTGGAESVFAFTYVFVVLEASVTLLRAGAVVAMVIGTLLFGGVLVLQTARLAPGILPPVLLSHVLFVFFIHTSGVGLVAVLASGLASKLRIAGRRLAEREEDLERLEVLQGAILRALPAGLLTVGPGGLVRFGNEAALSILHLTHLDLVGKPLARILPGVDAARSMLDVEPSSNRLAAGRRRHETSVELHDGERIRIGFSFAPLTMPDGPNTIVVFQDLTEVARLEEAVERAERLALVGKFAAGLAHEVRNPLASMCASIDVIEQNLDPPPPMKRLMANVVREAARLDHLIRDFLALARPRTLSFVREDLSALVAGVLEMFENDKLMQGIEVQARIEPKVEANVDPDLVRQVVWNLVRNAAEAMQGQGEGGTLGVDVHEGLGGAVVEISDTGPGLDEKQRRRAFDPFYTTKREGSGLGLSICQSIVHAHGGEIELEGRAGVGAKVILRFAGGVPGLAVQLRDLTPAPRRVESRDGPS